MDESGHNTLESTPSFTEDVEAGLEREPSSTELRDETLAVLWLLWRRRKFVAKFVTVVVVIVTIVVFCWPKTFKATAQLVPPESGSTTMSGLLAAAAGAGVVSGMTIPPLPGMRTSGALLINALRSRTMQDRLVDSLELKKVYGVRSQEQARKILSENTATAEDIKSGVITVTVSDHDPRRAKNIAEAYVDELNRLVADLNTSAAHRERVFIEDRLKIVKQELDDAAREFSQFASKNAAIDIPQQGRAMVEAAAALQGQLIAAESELKGLEQIYSSANVRVRAAQARVAELRAQLGKLGGKAALPDGSDSGDSAATYPSIRQLPLLGVKYSDLYRRTKINEEVFEILTKQYELAKVQEARETPTVRILDSPVVPERKSSPPRLLVMLASIPVALFVGCFWVLAAEKWRQIGHEDPRKLLASEITGSLGLSVRSVSHRALYFSRWRRKS